MTRPSHKELFNKLREAGKALSRGELGILNQTSLAADAIDLDYDLELDLVQVLTELIEEASPADYAGARPPQRSYEQKIEGMELLAFRVKSHRFKCRVYVKFALAHGMVWLISLHHDRPIRGDT